jgi:NitT/TauT family transport system substrate-binding protein
VGTRVRQRRNGLRGSAAAWLLLVACTVVLPQAAADAAPKKATLMPLWTAQAQFAGYYVALDTGIYAKHGIEMQILPAGPGRFPVQALQDGSADFAVLWLTTALAHRCAGLQLVNLAQVVQRSSMLLVARKSSGIRTVADIAGRKVGLWGGDLSIPPLALFARQGISVHEVRQSGTVNLFLRGGIDVASAMWYNEYHTILNSGLDPDELVVFAMHEYGLNFPEDGLYALQSTVQRDPALADAFVRASAEGWRYAFANPEQALDIVIGYMMRAHLPANRVHQRWMLNRMRDLVLPAEAQDRFGALQERDYNAVVSELAREGEQRACPDYRTFVRRSDAQP